MLAYCDYIADQIRTTLDTNAKYDTMTKVGRVGPIKFDLHPDAGYLVSTKKTIEVADINGKHYRVTVEEV